MNGKELAPSRPLNVFISNPERKKERTDAGANEKEVYVAGLAKSTTREDLDGVFKQVSVCCYRVFIMLLNRRSTQYGTIKDIRMAGDGGGGSKGFAFIEFDDEVSNLL